MATNNISVSDIKKTIANQAWRLNNLYTITNKDGKAIPFRMNLAQEKFFEEIHTNNVILKARQLGFSTLINLLQLDTALFIPNTKCGVIAHNDEAAIEIFDRNVKFPYEHLNDGAKSVAAKPVADSAHQFKFSNGSSIRVATSMRSGTLQILHVSEFGKVCAKFPERAREIVTGSLETVGAGNIVVIESTGEGNTGYFYEYVQSALEKSQGAKLNKSDYRLFFFPWWKEPTYRSSERREISRQLEAYFDAVEVATGITLDDQQKWWYAAKRETLKWDCLREYPSTIEEAFSAGIDPGDILRREWWREWKGKHPPSCIYIIQSYDTAFSDKDLKTNSFSARTTWGVFFTDDGNPAIMLIEAWRGRVDYPTLRAEATKAYREQQPDCVLIEKKASGQSLIQDMRRAGIPVAEYQPDRDKVSRAYAVQALLENGQIYYPTRRWADEVITECEQFPNGMTSDYVDTCTQAWLRIRNSGMLIAPEPKVPDEPDIDPLFHKRETPVRHGVYG